ncbi:MAG: leucine-rich repeat protein [Treponema sp.]
MKILNIKRKSRIFYWILATVMAAALVPAGCKTEANSGDEQTTETGKHDDKKKDNAGKGGDKDSQKGNGKGAGDMGKGDNGGSKGGGKDSGNEGTPSKPSVPQETYTSVKFSELDAYLAKASGDKTNLIEVTELTADDLKGETSKASKLGEALKKHSGKQVSLKFGGTIENLTDMTNCFRGCENLVSLDAIPTGVTNLSYCFYECASLTASPAIPTGVTMMDQSFFKCAALTKAPAIPEGVTVMVSCFSDCKNLTEEPSIPASVEVMSTAFANDEKLTSVHLKCKYDENNLHKTFRGCTGLPAGGIKVPKDELDAYKAGAERMGTTADKFAAED